MLGQYNMMICRYLKEWSPWTVEDVVVCDGGWCWGDHVWSWSWSRYTRTRPVPPRYQHWPRYPGDLPLAIADQDQDCQTCNKYCLILCKGLKCWWEVCICISTIYLLHVELFVLSCSEQRSRVKLNINTNLSKQVFTILQWKQKEDEKLTCFNFPKHEAVTSLAQV